jgi:hypothetical protein
MSIWKLIYDTLTENGIDVYPPSIKLGECTSPYTVIKQDGSSRISNFSSERVYYQFMIYVPKNQYDRLSEYEEQVKKIINEKLRFTLKPTGDNMTDYYDDNLKAHMRSFLYKNNVRNKYL